EVVKWELPTNFESFRTFIDHGCTLDPQNCPINPNSDTVFVKIPEDTVTNFGSVGFTKTTGTEHQSKGIWKIARIYCLGALVCEVESCMWIGSPPTGQNAVEAYLASGPKCKGVAGRCTGNVTFTGRLSMPIVCNITVDFSCKSSTLSPIKSNVSVAQFFLWFGSLTRRGLLVISCGFQEEDKHFTFQSKWMADQLLARDENNDVYQGGLISDVTYRFFDKGYLLTTSMFCEQTARWIPVQWSWIRGLSSHYYKIHFSVLLQQMIRPEITLLERDLMARQVVDFSLAQVEGFKDALREVFGIHDPIKLDSMVKGCHQHFRPQVGKIGRQRLIIPPDQGKRKEGTAVFRAYGNASKADRRPPDTTDGLLDGLGPVGRKKNLGRPKNLQNVDQNPYSTYQSYCQSDQEEHLTNRCWMSAAMESFLPSTTLYGFAMRLGKGQLSFTI
ncbi:hypothetical protein MJO28_009527, partial [Puccinia striiformis f. sp. tritici]